MGLQTFPWKKLSRNDHDRSQAIASLFFYPSSLHLFYLPQVRPSLCPPRHCVRPCFDSGSPTMIRSGNDPLERTKTKENGGKKRSVREFGGSLDERERETSPLLALYSCYINFFWMGSVWAGAHRPSYATCLSPLFFLRHLPPSFPRRSAPFLPPSLHLSVRSCENVSDHARTNWQIYSWLGSPPPSSSEGNGGERKSSAARIEGKLAFNGA